MSTQQQKAAAICLLMELDEEEDKEQTTGRLYWVGPLCATRKLEGSMNTTVPRLLNDGHRRTGQFSNYFRMDQSLFDSLAKKLEPLISPTILNMRGDQISARDRLGVTMRFLATGQSFNDLHYEFRMGVSTISGIVHKTCEAIYQVLKADHLQVPTTTEQWKSISEGFLNRWNYPNCVGAIDGKHILIRKPVGAGSEYHNYKGTESVVLMAVADARQRFIFVDVGSNGRASDGGVWKQCALDIALQNGNIQLPNSEPLPPTRTSLSIPYHFVADEAFPLTNYIMKPFPRRSLTEDQSVFNYRLSRARRIIENSFGRLSSMFRLFQAPLWIQPERLDYIILAACSLHNYILDNNKEVFTCDTDAYIRDGSWRNQTSSGGLTALTPQRFGNRPSANAKEYQTHLMNWFTGEGAVTWQDQMVNYAVNE